MSQDEANMAHSSVQLKKTSRRSKYGDINDSLYEWYLMATSKNIFPTGPLLTEKAKRIALHLSQHDFRGSSGWLTKWKQRFNVKRLTICGESCDVRGETVESWKERLPQILDGYDRKDIWNMDETGCFWKTLPDKGFARKGVKRSHRLAQKLPEVMLRALPVLHAGRSGICMPSLTCFARSSRISICDGKYYDYLYFDSLDFLGKTV